jgi:hypothetical protein
MREEGSSKDHVWLNFSWPIRFNCPDSRQQFMRGWTLAIGAYSRLRASCCFRLDHFVWYWSTSITEATTGDLENRWSPFFESWGGGSRSNGSEKGVQLDSAVVDHQAGQTRGVPFTHYLCMFWWSSRSYLYQRRAANLAFMILLLFCAFLAHVFHVLIPNVSFSRPFLPCIVQAPGRV